MESPLRSRLRSTSPAAGGDTDLRARAELALRAAARGEPRQVDVLLAGVERAAHGAGHALERALAHLARATSLALDGAAGAADAELLRALDAAASGRIDPDVVMAAIRELGDVVVVTGAGRRRVARAAALALAPDAVVLDARSDELVVRGAPRSLRRYPVRRRLLYALARRAGSVCSKDALIEAVWGCAYDPLRHDDVLKSNVLHLRYLLAGSGVAIACGHPGYRLDAPASFVFVSVFELGGAGSPRFTSAALPAIDP